MESGQSFTPVFISKLPPIHLTFKFNENYPLISSPDWKVSCEWLNSEAVSLLSFELQQLIKKNPSLPIISIWVNWLKNQSIYLFNIISCSSKNNNNNFSLSSLTTLEPNRDQKKVQDNYHFSIPQLYKKENFDVIKYIVQYDRLNIDDDFKTCSLCNTSQTFINFVQFFNCNHSYCKECTSAYITLNIETNCLENLVCPHDDCQVLISPFEIKELVPVDTFDFYLESLSNHSCQHCNYHHLSNNIDNINKASLLS
ncbi:hypothetical protein CYY_004530 [Polysphondylium violaceum]|uniref:RBR-type E3 ubiquitin transferase n=1 Tax=Polysphondylium violaceum TaxID=133409 RepID=A0A8J4V7P1_9MYCE|nr:hypothetical protein CYY_004530 [Polysphondylium violaceum]